MIMSCNFLLRKSSKPLPPTQTFPSTTTRHNPLCLTMVYNLADIDYDILLVQFMNLSCFYGMHTNA